MSSNKLYSFRSNGWSVVAVIFGSNLNLWTESLIWLNRRMNWFVHFLIFCHSAVVLAITSSVFLKTEMLQTTLDFSNSPHSSILLKNYWNEKFCKRLQERLKVILEKETRIQESETSNLTNNRTIPGWNLSSTKSSSKVKKDKKDFE